MSGRLDGLHWREGGHYRRGSGPDGEKPVWVCDRFEKHPGLLECIPPYGGDTCQVCGQARFEHAKEVVPDERT